MIKFIPSLLAIGLVLGLPAVIVYCLSENLKSVYAVSYLATGYVTLTVLCLTWATICLEQGK